MFDKVKTAVADVHASISSPSKGKQEDGGKPRHAHTHQSGECSDGDFHHMHRFQSFAPQREGNDVKWYVDGCGYFNAVSVALESAQQEIWILDW